MTRITHSASVPDTLDRGPDWRAAALCRTEEHDPELFFPKGYEGPWQLVIADAKKICARCPAADECLAFALAHNIGDGIFGGLTEKERKCLRRSVQRGKTAPEDVADKAAKVRRAKPKPRTLRSIFEANTVPLHGGHLGWKGPARPSFGGRDYTPKQLAFVVDRGHYPQGRVLVDCGVSGCVRPEHVADDEERMVCGTRPGYQRHLRDGSKVCGPCRAANTDADNRLRRTGTTKVAV